MSHLVGKELHITYDERIVIKNLDITIPQGKITTIIGPNGCGKSTLIKSLSRIIKPKSGKVYLNTIDLDKMTTKAIAKQLAILPQNPETPVDVTVKELLAYGRYAYQTGWGKMSKADNEAIAWAISVTDIESIESQYVASLSGGQR